MLGLIIEDGSCKTVKAAEEKAKQGVLDRKRGSFEIELKINGKHDIQINKTAYVKDNRTSTEGVFFIVGIRFTKDDRAGVEKVIRLRPLWEGL